MQSVKKTAKGKDMGQLKFKRYEFKYLFREEQYRQLLQLLQQHTVCDEYGKSTICNLYYDTPSHLLIRRSLEKPIYKEKLRLRCYGTPTEDSEVFVELKKKYQSVVFKRRIRLTLGEAKRFLREKQWPNPSQVMKEILYAFQFYQDLQPSMCIFYDREAFYGKNDRDLRITFDSNVLFRTHDLQLEKGIYGQPILPEGYRLLEVKTSKAIPLWLSHYLTEAKIHKTPFSKYGTAYAKTAQRSK